MRVAARQKADEASLGEIRRCTVVDIPEWGPWLLGCLREKWPTIGDGSLLGKIGAWSASNEFLFIRNDLAVLLAIGDPAEHRTEVADRTPHAGFQDHCRFS
jgi:hypothetical protein